MKKVNIDLLNPVQALSEFEKHFSRITYNRSTAEAFTDFIEYTFLMLNPFKKAQDFAELERKYPSKEEAVTLYQMLELLGAASADFNDAMGDLFMDLVSHGHNGQFFTPGPVCDMIAQMTIKDQAKDGMTVLDCAAGSGRMLLAAAKLNRNMVFTACDVDNTCVKMAVINFMLNTMQGDVVWMNTLSMEHFKTYRIGKVLSGTHYLPYYQELDYNPTIVQRVVEATKKQEKQSVGNTDIPVNNQVGQLIMF